MENNQAKEFTIEPGIPFKANGTTYTPSESFSIGRFEKVEELEEELLSFGDKKSCHDVMLRAMSLINSYNPGEAYTMLYNKIESDQRSAKLSHYMLRVCAAYINAEGEDTKYLSDEMIKTKIHDWSEEGLDVRPFLAFAVSVYRELFDRYKNPILHILTQAKTVKESLESVLDIKTLMEPSGPVNV